MEAPAIATLTTVAGAAILAAVLMQFIILPVLNLAPATQDRFGPILAIATGIAITIVATLTVVEGPTKGDVAQGAVNGIFAGLSAIGLHNVTTKSLKPPAV